MASRWRREGLETGLKTGVKMAPSRRHEPRQGFGIHDNPQAMDTRPTTPASLDLPARPLAQAPREVLAAIQGVMTDIDDTLTRDGAIEPAALQALHALHEAGLPVIAITGRPMGWSEPFAAAWPVAAIVAENGAVALLRDEVSAREHDLPKGLNGSGPAGSLAGSRGAGQASSPVPPVARSQADAASPAVRIEYAQDEAVRAVNALRLRQVAERILREVPAATLARDSAGRVTDIAIDHSEFAHLDAAAVAAVVAIMREEGMVATVSSIHINGWFGDHSKWSGACWMLRRLYGRDLAAELDRWVYVGDSTNDQPMFERFACSVGVANLRDFADRMTHWPTWITRAERGEGFAELAARLLAAR
jgi:hydroxymethylpyrimidine pyrophosphatase-like HAD family hydrolase